MNIYRTTEEMTEQLAKNLPEYLAELSTCKKQFSILHPYKNEQTALHLISPTSDLARHMSGLTMGDALAKIDPELFKDKDFALSALKTLQAFPYIDKRLRNDPEFLKLAIEKNHRVYDLIDPKFKDDPSIMEAYAKSLIASYNFCLVERGENVYFPPTLAISPNIDPSEIFTVDKYKHYFEEALKKPYVKDFRMDDHLSKGVTFIVAAQTLCPELASEYRAVEKEVFLNNAELIEKMMINGYARQHTEVRSLAETLEEVFADSPALLEKFEDLKRQSWELLAESILTIHENLMERDEGSLDRYQITLALSHFDEMKQYIPITQELKYALHLQEDPRAHKVYDPDGFRYEQDLEGLVHNQ